MFTRIIIFAALAVLMLIIWRRLSSIFRRQLRRQKDSLTSEGLESQRVNLEKDPETGHYRPAKSKEKSKQD